MKNVKITSFELESVSLCGLREVNTVININIDNPSIQFSINDLNAVLKYGGQECMIFEGSRIDVDAKSNKNYRVLVHGRLCDNFNPFVILGLLQSQDFEQCTLDLSGTAQAAGLKKKLSYKDICVKDLLKKI